MGIIASLRGKHPRLSRLLTSESVVGWLPIAIAGWKVCSNISTFQTAREVVVTIWGAVNGPHGTSILLAFGFLWLTAVALWPSRAKAGPPVIAIPTISTPPPSPSFLPRPPIVKDIDLRIEVLRVIFMEHPAGPYGAFLLGARDGWYILMNLRLINRGSKDAAVVKWEFAPVISVGEQQWSTGEASLHTIPANWYVELGSAHFGQKPTRIEIERPTLDQRVEREPLKPLIPQVGWVLFDYLLPANTYGPQNAGFRFELHDSAGNVHMHTEPGAWRDKSGEIKYDASNEEIAKALFPGDAKT